MNGRSPGLSVSSSRCSKIFPPHETASFITSVRSLRSKSSSLTALMPAWWRAAAAISTSRRMYAVPFTYITSSSRRSVKMMCASPPGSAPACCRNLRRPAMEAFPIVKMGRPSTPWMSEMPSTMSSGGTLRP